MIKQISYLAIALFCLVSISLDAQSTWTKSDISQFRDATEENKMIIPKEYIAYTLTYEALKEKLKNTPTEDDKRNGIKGNIIELPMPDGSFESFEVYDSPVFAPKLAAKYPMIKSYKGVSLKNPGMNVRFDTGPYGFHAAIHDLSAVYYIDPYARENTTEYLVYNVKDHLSQLDISVPMCGTHEEHNEIKAEPHASTRNSVPVPLNVYRFALSCTGEWGAIRGTVENALADMNTGVNRMNQIFENELALRLVLIDENDQLLNFDPQTDPYFQVAQGGDMLSVNTNITNNRVGSNAYDIGHVYHRSCDVGGIAVLGSMCNNNTKAAAVTCHYSNNLDYMAAAVTSHEVGHQMTANHTFNNCGGGGNENPGNAFEPGSGSTIMSYGGLCGGSLNVVNAGDDYYHVASLIEIYRHTRGDGLAGDGCAEIIETSNLEPTATILHPDGFTIPEDTYFYLEGEGMDENEEDQLTYTWEQMNRGPLSNLGTPIGDAPHFRSFPPSTNPKRFFPSVDNILNGTFDRTEVAFEGDRTVNFTFTVRDNNSEAGTAVWEEIEFHVVETPVKFGVTSQNSSETYEAGDAMEVTWNVAGTDVHPVNAERVDILFSTNNSASFDIADATVLAKNVFNNGSCKVIVPNEPTTRGRIIVKASESIFFSINKANIQVEEPTSPTLAVSSDPIAQIDCLPSSFTYELNSEDYSGVEGDITYTVLEGLPEGASVSFDPEVVEIGSPSSMNIDPVNDFLGGEYQIIVGAITEAQDTFTRTVYLNLKSNDHRTIDAITPENSAIGIGISPEFSWEGSINADTYTFELSKSPNFGANNLMTETDLLVTNINPNVFLEKNTAYYWRVTAINYCGEDPDAKVYAFNTESLFCSEVVVNEDLLPINISGSGTPTIQAPLEVELGGTVADVNIKQFYGEHENNKDMVVKLISPEGKEVVLVSKKCEQSNFNCGFDDASDVDVKCPLNNGSTYAPTGNLSDFNGDQLQGTWILQIEDTQSGNGGRLQNVIGEFCSNQVLDNPEIVRNQKISLPWDATRTISAGELKVEDANNSSEQLIYTIVKTPKKGSLLYDGNNVNPGDQFTQKDVDDNKLVYVSASEDYETYFSFTIIDGEGGFIGITNFDIDVNELTSTNDLPLQDEISIYPVPAQNSITVDFSKTNYNYNSFEIINLQGQSLIKANTNEKEVMNVDISQLNKGFYIIVFRTEVGFISKKIIRG